MLFRSGIMTRHNREIPVPDFTTLSMKEATVLARKNNVKLDFTDSVYVKRLARGAVYSQNPPAGSHVKKGRRILITINSVLPKKVSMPILVGFSLRQAQAEILKRGLRLGHLYYAPDMATNNVLEQRYRGMPVSPGSALESESEIDLVLGLNSSDNLTYVPFVKGFTYELAKNSIHDNSLNVGKVVYDNSVVDYNDTLKAVVYMQRPASSANNATLIGNSVDLFLTTDQTKISPNE